MSQLCLMRGENRARKLTSMKFTEAQLESAIRGEPKGFE